jgi:hypothetical protein
MRITSCRADPDLFHAFPTQILVMVTPTMNTSLLHPPSFVENNFQNSLTQKMHQESLFIRSGYPPEGKGRAIHL